MVTRSLALEMYCFFMKWFKTGPSLGYLSPILMQNYDRTSRSVNRKRIKERILANEKWKCQGVFGTACSCTSLCLCILITCRRIHTRFLSLVITFLIITNLHAWAAVHFLVAANRIFARDHVSL